MILLPLQPGLFYAKMSACFACLVSLWIHLLYMWFCYVNVLYLLKVVHCNLSVSQVMCGIKVLTIIWPDHCTLKTQPHDLCAHTHTHTYTHIHTHTHTRWFNREHHTTSLPLDFSGRTRCQNGNPWRVGRHGHLNAPLPLLSVCANWSWDYGNT